MEWHFPVLFYIEKDGSIGFLSDSRSGSFLFKLNFTPETQWYVIYFASEVEGLGCVYSGQY